MYDFFKKQNPLALCAFFAVLVAFCFFTNIASGLLALFVLLSFSFFVFLRPQNGFCLLIFFVPFFLGNSKREFYFLLEYCAFATLISSMIYIYRTKRQEIYNLRWNCVYIGLLLFTSCLLLSIPVNLKEFYYEVKGALGIDPVNYLKDQALLFSYGHEGKHIYWLRTLFNHLLGVALFFSVPFVMTKKDIKDMFNCVIFSFCIVLLGGYLFYYDLVPHKGLYFSLSLVGKQHGVGMTAFAYNRGYLAQYLICFIPVLFYFFQRNRKNIKGLAFIGLFIVGMTAIVLTTQRTSLFVFFIQLCSIPFYFLFISPYAISKKSLGFALLFVAVVSLMLFLADLMFLNSMLKNRFCSLFNSLGQRSHIWLGAFTMWKHNILLGVGLGRYHHFFPYYNSHVLGSQLMLERTTAHSLYLHILAQQGILTLFAFGSFLGALFYGVVQQIRRFKGEDLLILSILLFSLIGFLGYGIGQYMFYVRSVALSFWIISGLLYFLIKDYMNYFSVKKAHAVVGVMLFVGLLIYRLYSIAVWSL